MLPVVRTFPGVTPIRRDVLGRTANSNATLARNLYLLRHSGRPVSVQQNQQVASGAERSLLEQRPGWLSVPPGSPRQHENYNNHEAEYDGPQCGHDNEFDSFHFGITTCRQDYVALVPPKETSERSEMDEEDKPHRNKRNDGHQQAQARKKPRRCEQVMNAHPRQPNNDRGEHHLVLMLDHKGAKSKASGSFVNCCHGTNGYAEIAQMKPLPQFKRMADYGGFRLWPPSQAASLNRLYRTRQEHTAASDNEDTSMFQ